MHSMSCFVSKISYERCACSTSCEAAMASEHDLDITTSAPGTSALLDSTMPSNRSLPCDDYGQSYELAVVLDGVLRHYEPMVLVSYKLRSNIGILQTKLSNREGHEA